VKFVAAAKKPGVLVSNGRSRRSSSANVFGIFDVRIARQE
jgi:hypothetical protein